MKKRLILLAALSAASISCEKGPQGEGEEPIITEPMIEAPSVQFNLITMEASSEEPDTKTTLSGLSVLWDSNDQIRVVEEVSQQILLATVNGISQGVGIPIAKTSGTAYLKYDYIKVVLNGKDITSEITTGAHNDYKLGTYSNKGYVYAKPGETIQVDINEHGIIPIVQSSSGSRISTSNVAVVSLGGIEYSLDQKEWISVTSTTALSNGNAWGKGDVSFEWQSNNADLCMTLSSDPGSTRGEFAGLIDSSLSIDEKAMAIYPYGAYKLYDNGIITLDIPGTQTYVENSFDHTANVMVGAVSNGENGYDVSFKNMMGVLQLSLTGDYSYLSSITVTDKAGEPLWGTAKVPVSAFEDGISTSMLNGGSSSITLDCSGVVLTSEPTVFDVVVPVDAFSSGLKISVITDDMASQSLSSSSPANKILRSDIKQMPQVSVTKLVPGSVNIENKALQTYMSYGKYDKFGSTSYFGSHADVLNSSLCTDQDRPETLTINWIGDDSGTYTVSFTDKTSGRQVFEDRSVTGSSYVFEIVTSAIPLA